MKNKNICISRNNAILIILIILGAYIFFTSFVNRQRSTNTRASESTISMAVSRKNSYFVSSCNNLNGNAYISCVSHKLNVAQSDLASFKRWNLFYKGKKIQRTHQAGSTNLKIGPVFISKDLSKEYAAHIISLIKSVWSNEKINKKLVVDEQIVWFDNTITTNCFIEEYWSKNVIYFPDVFCDAGNNAYPIGVQRISKLEGQVNVNMGMGNYMYIDGDLTDMEEIYTYKHEIGHMLGAIDSDLVDIRPNSLFPSGNSRNIQSDPEADIMYTRTLTVGNFTRYSINSTLPYTIIDPYSDWQTRIRPIAQTKFLTNYNYTIYGALGGGTHISGAIIDEPVCSDKANSSGIIDLASSCPKLLYSGSSYRYVAGFIIINDQSNNYVYKGKFDFIDMIMSRAKSEPYKVIDFLKIESPSIKPTSSSTASTPLDTELIPLSLYVDNYNPTYSLSDLQFVVNNIPNFKLIDWKLCWGINSIVKDRCNLLLSGAAPVMGDEMHNILIPNVLKGYKGKLYLELQGSYTPLSGIPGTKIFTYPAIIIFYDGPKIEYINAKENQFEIIGNGFLQDNKSVDVIIDNESISKKNTIKIVDISEHMIQLSTPTNMNNKLHTFIVVREKTKSDLFTYKPPIKTQLFNFKSGTESFHLDQSETAIIHLEFECTSDLTNVIFGVEAAHQLFQNKYNASYASCKKNEKRVFNFKIPAKEIFTKIIDNYTFQIKYGYAYSYACVISKDPTNVYFNDQKPEIISIFNLSKTNGLFYNCIIPSTISFVKRLYN